MRHSKKVPDAEGEGDWMSLEPCGGVNGRCGKGLEKERVVGLHREVSTVRIIALFFYLMGAGVCGAGALVAVSL